MRDDRRLVTCVAGSDRAWLMVGAIVFLAEIVVVVVVLTALP